jgi:predicted nuclease with TOPRIM domain
MDPVSVTVSVITLIDASYRLCDIISDVKDGGKERMKLLREISNLCCTLDTLKERFDTSEAEVSALSQFFNKDGGPIHQCAEIVDSLTKKLTSSQNFGGRLAQQLKWNFDKREVLQAMEQLHC